MSYGREHYMRIIAGGIIVVGLVSLSWPYIQKSTSPVRRSASEQIQQQTNSPTRSILQPNQTSKIETIGNKTVASEQKNQLETNSAPTTASELTGSATNFPKPVSSGAAIAQAKVGQSVQFTNMEVLVSSVQITKDGQVFKEDKTKHNAFLKLGVSYKNDTGDPIVLRGGTQFILTANDSHTIQELSPEDSQKSITIMPGQVASTTYTFDVEQSSSFTFSYELAKQDATWKFAEAS